MATGVTKPLLDSSDDSMADGQVSRGTLSTFFGVFVPCVLSIFSVVLFLRMGYVLGQAGLILTLVMLIAYSIVGFTILSISAISTNGLVKGGGAYYMISRSLGPEFGGSIGIIFFFANIFASGLYVAGFVETLYQNIDGLSISFWTTYGLGSAVLAFCLAVCLIGAGAFAKASFVIFLVVITSTIVAMANFFYAPENLDIDVPPLNTIKSPNTTLVYSGFSRQTLEDNLYPSFKPDYSVAADPLAPSETMSTVFGVLFNGCTGIMAGANMSGDLKDPSLSIPKGTIQAAGFTFVVYAILFVMSAATSSRDLLHNNYGFLQEVNMVPGLIVMGIFAATLSAALSTLIGASRILQAISRDNLLGDWFTFFSLEKGEPVRAVFACWFMVQLVLLIGSINVIAPIVSMLFLLSYAITNFACFVLRVTGAPNFRPRFRQFSWHTAFIGFISCVIVMFFIEPTYAAASILLMLILFSFIHVRHVPVTWGDVSQALIYHQVRKYLLRLEVQCLKYWRPQILLLVVNPRSSFSIVQFANYMKKGGLFILGHVVVGETNTPTKNKLQSRVHAWQALDRVAKVKAFVDCVIAPTVRAGVQGLIMMSGLGGMKPNIVLLGFFRESASTDQLLEYRDELQRRKEKNFFVDLKRVHEMDSLTEQFQPLAESRAGQQKVTADDYVGIISDALTLDKNVGVVRNFGRLLARMAYAKAASKSGDSQWFIDVWPIVPHAGRSRYTYELLLQLATIVNMVHKIEKYTKMRINSVVSTSNEIEFEFKRISDLVHDLRIKDHEAV